MLFVFSHTRRHGRQEPNSGLQLHANSTLHLWAEHRRSVAQTTQHEQTRLQLLSPFYWASSGKGREQPWAVCHHSRSIMGKDEWWACLQTPAILEEDIHLLVFSCSQGALRSGSVTDWHPCREEKSQMIFLTSRGPRHPRACCDIQ